MTVLLGLARSPVCLAAVPERGDCLLIGAEDGGVGLWNFRREQACFQLGGPWVGGLLSGLGMDSAMKSGKTFGRCLRWPDFGGWSPSPPPRGFAPGWVVGGPLGGLQKEPGWEAVDDDISIRCLMPCD